MNLSRSVCKSQLSNHFASLANSAECNFSTAHPRNTPAPIVRAFSARCSTNIHIEYLTKSCPHPPLRQLRQVADIQRRRLLVLCALSAFPFLLHLPLLAALLNDACKQHIRRLVIAPLSPRQFGFGGDEPALACGLEYGLAVALELRFCFCECPDARVQLGEKLLDFGDDAALFGEGRVGC